MCQMYSLLHFPFRD